MNDNTLKRKLLIVIGLLVSVVVIVSLAGYALYVYEQRKHLMKARATFDVDVIINNVTLPGNIESVELVICGEKRLIKPYKDKDGVVCWGGFISSPKQLLSPEGAPCPVEILITKDGNTKSYPADQLFSCPDCSGLHYYEIVGDKAIYKYSP